jgi:flagellar hook-length control protein FliK
VERAHSSLAPARSLASPLLLQLSPGFEAELAIRAREFLERGETRIRVALDPPSLGRIVVRLEVSEHHALARIVVSHPETASLLSRERDELVRAFQGQGFDDVQVHVESESESNARGRNGAERWEDDVENVPAPASTRNLRTLRAPRIGGSLSVDLFV